MRRLFKIGKDIYYLTFDMWFYKFYSRNLFKYLLQFPKLLTNHDYRCYL